jgi:hypothetical protein
VRGRETHEKASRDIGYKWLHKTHCFPFYELRAAAWDIAKIRPDASSITEDADRRIEAQFQTLMHNNIEFVVLLSVVFSKIHQKLLPVFISKRLQNTSITSR